MGDDNVSNWKDNALGASVGGEGGVTPHIRVRPKQNDTLSIIASAFTPNSRLLYQYFPLLAGRSSKSLFALLMVVYRYPLRTMSSLHEIALMHNVSVTKNLLILIDLGYIQAEHKPRRIILFNTYTVDNVYRITRKGVKVLSAITGY